MSQMGMMPQGGGMPGMSQMGMMPQGGGMPSMPQQMQQGMPNPYSQAQSREIDENFMEETEEDE